MRFKNSLELLIMFCLNRKHPWDRGKEGGKANKRDLSPDSPSQLGLITDGEHRKASSKWQKESLPSSGSKEGEKLK